MNTQLKEMKLSVKKISHDKYVRTITDMNSIEIWNGGEQYYVYMGDIVMDNQKMGELITQMQQLPFWNIVDIENDFS
jgi:uncharacterized protein with gpF-like domain